MLQLNIPKLEEDILASSLRQYQSRLKEVLDGIERRTITVQEVQDHLSWVAAGLRTLRKRVPPTVSFSNRQL